MKIVFVGVLSFMLMMTGGVYADEEFPFLKGEVVEYTIKKLGLKVGEASLTYEGAVEFENQDFLLVVFDVDAIQLADKEYIYLDPETFRPVVVRREVELWGKEEIIEERYVRNSGKVTVTKVAGGETTTEVIERSNPLDNLYGFFFYYRSHGQFTIGETHTLYLPTRDIAIKLIDEPTISAAGEDVATFHFESEPKKYSIWFDQGPKKIPVRMDGTGGFGKTVFIMKSYKESSVDSADLSKMSAF